MPYFVGVFIVSNDQKNYNTPACITSSKRNKTTSDRLGTYGALPPTAGPMPPNLC